MFVARPHASIDLDTIFAIVFLRLSLHSGLICHLIVRVEIRDGGTGTVQCRHRHKYLIPVWGKFQSATLCYASEGPVGSRTRYNSPHHRRARSWDTDMWGWLGREFRLCALFSFLVSD